ncbi:MAG: hypothetical protein HPY76_12235, partial [Anaerolineae bacterium]|nr:hypothetical protein [Anaerolineae bacterium]
MDHVVSKSTVMALKQYDHQKMNDIFSLINLFPLPMLCIDKASGTILHINSELCTLTGYQNEELRDNKIDKLFNGVNADYLVNRGTVYFLSRSHQPPLPVRVNVHYIDKNEEYVALIIFPSQPTQQEESLNYHDLITQLLDLDECRDEIQTCGELASIIAKALDVDDVLVYMANSNTPNLNLVGTTIDSTQFPSTVPAGDLIKLKHTQLWRPNMPVNNDIHRTGRIEHYNFLAS